MFNLTALAGRPDEDSLLRMEQDLHAECEQWGVVERLQSSKATGSDCEIRDSWCGSDAVKELDGRMEGSEAVSDQLLGRVTDFTVRDEVKNRRRDKSSLGMAGAPGAS
jgi:hypothetical protein